MAGVVKLIDIRVKPFLEFRLLHKFDLVYKSYSYGEANLLKVVRFISDFLNSVGAVLKESF